MTFYFSFMGRTIASRYLLKFQSHMGTHLECRYNLMTFGIPPEILPVDDDGTVTTKDYEQLLARVARKEESDDSSGSANTTRSQPTASSASKDTEDTELVPGDMDVVMGRGSTHKRGQGYANLKALLERHYEEYYSVTRFEKTVISRMIYERMVESGSRFMAKATTKKTADPVKGPVWYQLDEEDARDRIAHAFRNLRQLKTS